MGTMRRFTEYYEAFEATYLDDDWSRLEPLFTPDAVYRVVGSQRFDCELRGRDAIFAGLRRFLDGFDRRCERRLEAIGAPVAEGDTVRLRGIAWYRRGASEEFGLELEEEIVFEEGRIVRLTDTYPPDFAERVDPWLEKWGAGLDPSYV
jgi:hypothetical protein